MNAPQTEDRPVESARPPSGTAAALLAAAAVLGMLAGGWAAVAWVVAEQLRLIGAFAPLVAGG